MVEPGFEAAAPERRRFILVVALANLAFLAVDLQLAWPSTALVVAGRIAISALLLCGVALFGRQSRPAVLRVVIRAVTAGVAAAFSVLVWGTGGSGGPYLVFLPLLAIVVTIAVPDDPVATGLAAGIATAGGLGRVLAEGAAPSQLAFWLAAFGSTAVYAVTGSLLHLRALQRVVRLEAEREQAVQRLLAEKDQQILSALDQELQAKQLEALHHYANEIFLLLAPDGTLVQVNDRALQAYGYSEEEMLGLNVRDLRDPASAGEVTEFLRRTIELGGLRFTTRHRRRDGTLFPVEVSSRELRIGAGIFLQSIVRDLTAEQAAQAAREQAEAALRASQERLERILGAAAEGIVVSDASGVIRFANARAAELLGCAPAELPGQPALEALPPALREQAARGLPALGRGERFTCEARSSRPGGGEQWLLYSASRVADPEGGGDGLVGVLMDETPLRRTQAQLLQAQKMEAVGRLASGIAHDFNNLLVVILGNARFLHEELPGGSPLREDAEGIREAGERAARLVQQLLAFSRKSVAHPAPHPLGPVVLGIEKLVRRTIGEDVSVGVTVEPDGWSTRIDPGQLEQVLMNLAVNARDAMPGGGALRIRTRNQLLGSPPPPELEGLAPGRWVALEVGDTGSGMDAETLSRIFEPFFTTKERGKGTGLGLATVYGIAEQAGGRVTVSSAPGAGSTFTVWLPACEPAEASVAPALEERRRRGRGETVLVVEDDQPVRQGTRRMLERSGFAVLEADSAGAALALLDGREVDLVLSDMVMPGLSGAELAAQLARDRPGLPVVLMTGYSDRQAPGEVPTLAKPFTEQALVRRLLLSLQRPGAAPSA